MVEPRGGAAPILPKREKATRGNARSLGIVLGRDGHFVVRFTVCMAFRLTETFWGRENESLLLVDRGAAVRRGGLPRGILDLQPGFYC